MEKKKLRGGVKALSSTLHTSMWMSVEDTSVPKRFHGSCSWDKWIYCNFKVSNAEGATFPLHDPTEKKSKPEQILNFNTPFHWTWNSILYFTSYSATGRYIFFLFRKTMFLFLHQFNNLSCNIIVFSNFVVFAWKHLQRPIINILTNYVKKVLP